MTITKDMSMADVLKANPQAGEVMMKYGLHCVGCPMTMMETLEQGAKGHGLSDKDLEKMLEEINSE